MKNLRNISTALLALIVLNATANVAVRQGEYNPVITRGENTLDVSITMRLADIKVKSEQQLTVTPSLTSENQKLTLPVVLVTGRKRSIRDARDGVANGGFANFRAGKVPDSISYHVEVPIADWMLDSKLVINDSLSGCNCSPVTGGELTVAEIDLRPKVFSPQYVYLSAYTSEGLNATSSNGKIREAAGHAYIDFPVNQTKIYPDYRRNPAELAEIRDTIELIKRDPDYTITELTLKGYASPEGTYTGNERLAKGRTEALKNYINSIYSFPNSLITLSWEAEDWQGLVEWLRKSDIKNRDRIIEICTSSKYDGDNDRREWILKTTYPEQYRHLLANVYPGLRHTDYTVRYTVRTFTSVDEIARVMKEAPHKLSLDELYMFARTLTPGTPEYTEVYETALRLYPDAPEANLNAAVAALQADELARASRYLERAGDFPEATYARGILAAKQFDYDKALPLLEAAEKAGVTQSADARRQIEEIMKRLPKKHI